MNVRHRFCTPMSAAAWLATGLAFLAIGLRQPAFIAIGTAFITLGVVQMASARRKPQ